MLPVTYHDLTAQLMFLGCILFCSRGIVLCSAFYFLLSSEQPTTHVFWEVVSSFCRPYSGVRIPISLAVLYQSHP
ncbi:MAG: hypothetical protein JOS17DRAFT_764612 [Linnemannia elongata]|nr:MAG: hypothetical protein JOS17DRAFT_764612 [Linnemannia elongata]